MPNQILQEFFIRSIADNTAIKTEPTIPEPGTRFDQLSPSFFFDEPSNRDNPKRFRSRNGRFENRRVQPVVDSKDLIPSIGKFLLQPICAVIGHPNDKGSLPHQIVQANAVVRVGTKNVVRVAREAVGDPKQSL